MSLQNIAIEDSLYNNAVFLVKREGKASTSFIQRHLQIGYNRAARIMEQMEKEGVVSNIDNLGKRAVIGFEQKEDFNEGEIMSKAENLEQKEQARVDAEKAQKPELPLEDNSTDIGGVAGKRLKSFLDRVERMEEEKKGIADDIKHIYAEAKAVGFDVKTMRKVLKLRKMETEKRREEEELMDLYCAAIGLE